MKKFLPPPITLLLVCTAFLPHFAHAAQFTSTRSGSLTDPQTWSSNNKIGSVGTGDGQFSASYSDLAIDALGNIYISDSGNNRIQKFDAAGHFVLKWGTTGTAEGQFNDPRGITIDSDGNIWIGDSKNNRIQKFTPQGTFILMVGGGVADGMNQTEVCTSNCLAGTGVGSDNSGMFHSADDASVAADSTGHIYAGDYTRIQKFTTSGTFITAWTVSGGGNNSIDLAVDSSGNVYSSEYGNERIEKFSPTGTLIMAIGWGVTDGSSTFQICTSNCQVGVYGTGNGQFALGLGITVDSQGNIYASELQGNRRVQKFDASGNYVTSWIVPNTTAPTGLGIGTDDVIYVAGFGDGFYKYSPSGKPISFTCAGTNSCVAGTDYPNSSSEITTISSSTIVTIASSTTPSLGSISISSGGTLTQGENSTLTISGNWINQGTYTGSTGAQVVLNGTNQSILGATTFENLSKSSTVADTLSFDSANTTAVSGNLTLSGTAGNVLSLRGATFSIPTWVSEIPGSAAPAMTFPEAITMDTAGNTYVADCGSNAGIYKFNSSGTLVLTVGVGTFNCLYGVAVDPSGNMYTVDENAAGYIYKFAPDGTEIAHWGPDGIGGSQTLDYGSSVLYDDGHLFVTSFASSGDPTAGIYEFDTSGNLIRHFGASELLNVYGIAADSAHNIYAVNYNLNTVYKYSPSGTLMSSFKVTSANSGAEYVAVDSNGLIYVTRYQGGGGDNRVYVFSPDYTLLTTFGSTGTGHGQFSFYDGALYIDATNHLYVADNNADVRIQKFSITRQSTWGISASSRSLSYLSVANSTATSLFSCTTGCTDGGGNTNWDFGVTAPSTDTSHRGRSGSGPSSAVTGSTANTTSTVSPTPSPALTSIHTQLTSLVSTYTEMGVVLPMFIQKLLSASSPVFSPLPAVARDLQAGKTGSDVQTLQQYLILRNTGPAARSLAVTGSTQYYGPLTKAALAEFQLASGITPAVGYYGPITRAFVSSHSYSNEVISSISTVPVSTTSGNTARGTTSAKNVRSVSTTSAHGRHN